MTPKYPAIGVIAVLAATLSFPRAPTTRPPLGSHCFCSSSICCMCSTVTTVLPASQNRMLGLFR